MQDLPPLLRKAHARRARRHAAIIFVGMMLLGVGSAVIAKLVRPAMPLDLPWWIATAYVVFVTAMAFLMARSARFRLLSDEYAELRFGRGESGDICDHFLLDQARLKEACLGLMHSSNASIEHIEWYDWQWDVSQLAGKYIAFLPGRFRREADSQLEFEACSVALFTQMGWQPTPMLLPGDAEEALAEFVRMSMEWPGFAEQVEQHGLQGEDLGVRVPTRPFSSTPGSMPDPFNPPNK